MLSSARPLPKKVLSWANDSIQKGKCGGVPYVKEIVSGKKVCLCQMSDAFCHHLLVNWALESALNVHDLLILHFLSISAACVYAMCVFVGLNRDPSLSSHHYIETV